MRLRVLYEADEPRELIALRRAQYHTHSGFPVDLVEFSDHAFLVSMWCKGRPDRQAVHQIWRVDVIIRDGQAFLDNVISARYRKVYEIFFDPFTTRAWSGRMNEKRDGDRGLLRMAANELRDEGYPPYEGEWDY